MIFENCDVGYVAALSCSHIFMKRCTHGAIACIQLFYHSFNLLAEASLIQVETMVQAKSSRTATVKASCKFN